MPLEKEFKYYIDHQSELVEKFNGKWLIIMGDKVINSFDTKELAYNYAVENKYLGNALIQFCSPGTSAYTQIFHSRVAF
jgi:hypothetical protein